MKKLSTILSFLSIVLIFSANRIYAQEVTTMTVYTRDGNTIDFQLDKHPVTTFVEGNLQIVADDFTVLYPLENMWKYTFSATDAAVTSPDTDRLRFSRVGDTIYISGIEGNTPLDIISMDGRLIYSIHDTDAGHCTIDCSNLPSGIFILKIGKTAFKIIN